MPKIKNLVVYILEARHTIELHYGMNEKFHAKKLPEGMMDLPGAHRQLTGIASIETLESNVYDFAKMYNAARTKTRKVLIVKATLNTKTREAVGITSWSHQLSRTGQQNNHGFDFNFYVAEEQEFGNKKKYKRCDRESHHIGATVGVDSQDIILDYTEEREATLQQLLDHTTKLGQMLYQFFGDDSQQFALNIDNGLKLLR